MKGSGLIPTVTLGFVEVPHTYTVSYNGNGNTGGSTASSSHTYGTAKNLTANGFTKTGYTFAGWATSASGPVVYPNRCSVNYLTATNGATVTLYAKWILNTYTVSYNGNGNTGGSTASSSHTYGAAKNLTANGFTKTGYRFAGWATSASGSVVYSNGQSVSNLTMTNGATVYLYAKWAANTYTVTLDKQGGTGGISSVSATYDASMPSASAPTKNGCNFGGYYTGTNGTGTQYYTASMASARTWNIAQNTTLYAYWIGRSYTITTVENGGNTVTDPTYTVSPSSQIQYLASPTYATAYTVSYNANGHGSTPSSQTSTKQFSGWDITTNSSPVSSVSAQTLLRIPADAYGNITVTAQWGAQQAITLPTPSLAGYTFGGWYGEAACTNLVGNGGASYTPSANKMLYAKWTANTYTVSYNCNGCTGGSTASSNHTYGIAKNLTANGFTKTGYKFVGWATSASGSVAYSDMQTVSNLTATNDATITLYAKWVVDEEAIEDLLATNAALLEQIAALRQDTTSLNDLVDALQADTTTYLNKIAEMQKDTATLHNKIAELQADTASCSQSTAALSAQIAGLRADTAELYLQNKDLQNQLSAAAQDLASLQDDLTTANSANSTLQTQNADLQNQLSEANQSITVLQSDWEMANNTIKTLYTDKTTLQTQLAAANDSINTLQEQIGALRADSTNLASQNEQLAADTSSLHGQLTEANNSVAAQLAQIESLRTDSTNLASQNEQLAADTTSLREQLAETSQQLTEASKQLADVSKQLTDMSKQLVNVSQQLVDANGIKAAQQSQISALRADSTALADAKEQLAADTAALNSQIADLQAQLTDCRTSKPEPTAVADVETHGRASLHAYPNPTSSRVTVEHADLRAGDAIEVLTTAGKQVASFTATSPTSIVNLDGIIPGTYIIRIQRIDASAKVVKQ